ncbi:TIR domain-containing protein [Acuticoccus sp. I52.16.1]|uniref:TIR domain-containing protein n=1 Tax=Acuticoccus sp. I52.16.1 TaxID=2928472 RepID=UPI001FD3F964|nr:TIR domain-containing protein [Acuticoccus sp. I52.16.1]UOM36731.1 TIR domain-containing protein [Acuticoccus sp. I52.16.1]
MRVFVSYSRSDMAMVDAITAALADEPFEWLVDRESLDHGEKWREQIVSLILSADVALWLLTERSIRSVYCRWELDHLTAQRKKVIPVVMEPLDLALLPLELGERQAFPSVGVFDLARDRDLLVATLLKDVDWLTLGTFYLGRARNWDDGGRRDDRLLKGLDVRDAEAWRDRQPPHTPAPSSQVLEYLRFSRQGLRRRRRLFASVASVALVVVLAAMAFILLLRTQATQEAQLRRVAHSYEMAQRLRVPGPNDDPVQLMAEALAAIPSPDARGTDFTAPELTAQLTSTLAKSHLGPQITSPHDGPVTALALAPHQGYLASASAAGVAVHTLEPVDPAPRMLEGVEGTATALAILRNDTHLVVGTDTGAVQTFSMPDLRLIRTVREHAGAVSSLVHLDKSQQGYTILGSTATDGTAQLHGAEGPTTPLLKHLDAVPLPTAEGIRRSGADGAAHSAFAAPWRSIQDHNLGLGVTGIARFAKTGEIVTAGEDGRLVRWSKDGQQIGEYTAGEEPILSFASFEYSNRLGIMMLGMAGRVAVFDHDLQWRGDMQMPTGSTVPANQAVVDLGFTGDGLGLFGRIEGKGRSTILALWNASSGELARFPPLVENRANMMRTATGDPIAVSAIGDIVPADEAALGARVAPRNIVYLNVGGSLDQPVSIHSHLAPVTIIALDSTDRWIASADVTGGLALDYLENNESRQVSSIVVGVGNDDWIARIDVNDDASAGFVATGRGQNMLVLSLSVSFMTMQVGELGVRIESVLPGSVAEGILKAGDVLVKVEDVDTYNAIDVVRTVRGRPGESTTFTLLRDGAERTVIIAPRTVAEEGEWIGQIGVQLTDPEQIVHWQWTGDDVGLAATVSGTIDRVAIRREQVRITIERDTLHDAGQPILALRRLEGETAVAIAEDGTLVFIDAGTGATETVTSTTAAKGTTAVDPETRRRSVAVRALRGPRSFLVADRDEESLTRYENGIPTLRRSIDRVVAPDEMFFAVAPSGLIALPSRVDLERATPNPAVILHSLESTSVEETPREIALPGPGSMVTALAFSNDSQTLIAATSDYRMFIVNVETGEVAKTIPLFGFQASRLEVSEGGERVIALGSDKIRVFDLATGVVLYANDSDSPESRSTGADADRSGTILVTTADNFAVYYELPQSMQETIAAICERIPAAHLDAAAAAARDAESALTWCLARRKQP